MKHGNISLFVPHNGCPNQCSFCNQKSITGTAYQPKPEDVDAAVKNALDAAAVNKNYYKWEIAFFGGSFTAIERIYMELLLKAAYKYVENGTVAGIRISTRPDAIERQVLDTLKKYGVTAIELGAQSMCDETLAANLRGHTADDVRKASALIKEYGFSLGLQMMTGLYKSSDSRDIKTAQEIISLSPDTVRIYPTVTMKNTMLGELFNLGEYKPKSLEESVNLCALLLKMFSDNNIEVIRLGLHYSDELKRDMLYNNYHPAFRELCESRIMLDEFLRLAEKLDEKDLTVYLNPSDMSRFVGQKRANMMYLSEMGYRVKTVYDAGLSKYQIRIKPGLKAQP